MKKLGVSLALVVALLLSVVNTTYASDGWKNLGVDGINFYNFDMVKNKKSGQVYYSQNNGNVAIKISNKTAVHKSNGYLPVMEVRVYEDDGTARLDDWIGTFLYYPNKEGTVTKIFNVDKYRDGLNNRAEIQVVYTTNFQGTMFANILD